jgi:hypothetical protein
MAYVSWLISGVDDLGEAEGAGSVRTPAAPPASSAALKVLSTLEMSCAPTVHPPTRWQTMVHGGVTSNELIIVFLRLPGYLFCVLQFLVFYFLISFGGVSRRILAVVDERLGT